LPQVSDFQLNLCTKNSKQDYVLI